MARKPGPMQLSPRKIPHELTEQLNPASSVGSLSNCTGQLAGSSQCHPFLLLVSPLTTLQLQICWRFSPLSMCVDWRATQNAPFLFVAELLHFVVQYNRLCTYFVVSLGKLTSIPNYITYRKWWDDLWVINLRGFGWNVPWSVSRYNGAIFLERTIKTTKQLMLACFQTRIGIGHFINSRYRYVNHLGFFPFNHIFLDILREYVK